MKTMRYVLAGALLVSQIPAAQAQVQSRQAVLTSITKADMRLLITLEGHTIIAEDFYSVPSVRAKAKDGLIFQIHGANCTTGATPRCTGAVMQVRYDDDDRVTYEGVNEANVQAVEIAAWWDRDLKTVGFSRFVVLDGGVTMMNLRHNLRTMLTYVPSVTKYPFP